MAIKPTRQILLILTILSTGIFHVWSGESDGATLWLTSDLEGYLVGCECPTGFSAGISAVMPALAERSRESEPLVDMGGYREPGRSDALLEAYLDKAAGILDYSAMIAVSADLRDGASSYSGRRNEVPVSVAASTTDSRVLRILADEDRAVIVDADGVGVAIAGWFGRSEQAALDIAGSGKMSPVPFTGVLNNLAAADAGYRILAIRGEPGEWDTASAGAQVSDALPDLLIYTGPDSPAYSLSTGSIQGYSDIAGVRIPWLSIAPRGNGLARVRFQSGQDPEIVAYSLERGVSPESQEILELGEAFMEDLVATALAAAGRSLPEAGEGQILKADYWYPYGCRDCDDFLWSTVPELERDSGRAIEIREWNTSDPDDFSRLLAELSSRDIELSLVPVMIIENRVFQGGEIISRGLEDLAHARSVGEVAGSGHRAGWEPGAIFLAGLLDGVNPCAFSAMVFLISTLALAGRSKRTMLAIGFFYTAGIFLTYGLIGAGLLGGLRRIAVDSGIRQILEYGLAGLFVVLAVLSFLDGIRLSRGRSDLLLKLPERLSRRVHGIIRNNVRSGAAAGGSFLLGAAVALIELGCTGQVYLPTIAWMISRGEGASPWLWLLIYNSAFIIPLVFVFVVSYKGVTAVRLAGAFRKRGALVKYATACLFIILALFLVLA